MREALKQSLEAELGTTIGRATALAGGDINEAYRVELANGQIVFVKANASAPVGFFEAEAAGLEWLRQADALRVPRVLHVATEASAARFLALEFIEPSRPAANFDEALGRGLATLHRHEPRCFGLASANFIGSLPQPNTPHPTWAEFYRSERLEPQLARAVNSGKASYAVRRGFERLFDGLATLVGPAEPPARLHGDLWSGNVHVDENGAACLIDPAVHGGHREVDLAMMRLFGGFSERVFAAYDEAHRLAPGAAERCALYQLYPLLVHVNLFGGSYIGSVERALGRYV